MTDVTDTGPLRSANRVDSFRHAFSGAWYLIRSQPNTWIHAGFTVFALVMGLWLRIEALGWALVVLAGGLVWTAEAVNTALEATVDVATEDYHPLAKVGKDVAAAAVLIAAGTAVLVGLIIFGPPLWAKIEVWLSAL